MITIRTEILNETDNSVKQSIKKYTDPIDAMLGLATELGFDVKKSKKQNSNRINNEMG